MLDSAPIFEGLDREFGDLLALLDKPESAEARVMIFLTLLMSGLLAATLGGCALAYSVL